MYVAVVLFYFIKCIIAAQSQNIIRLNKWSVFVVVIDQLPLWLVYLLTVGLFLLAAEIGFRVGTWMHRWNPTAQKGPTTGAVVGSLLGLLAFLLAFTIGIVLNQHNQRKAMVVAEANAIGTSYLRAGFLNETDRDATRDLLKEYVEVRLVGAADPAHLESALTRSEEIHGQLWSIVEDNVSQGQDSDIMALFVESVNDVIDMHTLRLTAGQMRLPKLFGLMFYAAAVVSFLLMGIVDSSEGERNPTATVLFALALVAVLMIIVNLDRPFEGLLTISQTSMSDLLDTMR